MPLETGTYIRDLNASNPGHTDQLNQNDGHLRFIKASLLATFPNFTSGPINSTQAAIDAAVASITGATNTAIRFFAGTAALPGITPATDTDSGLYLIAEDTLGVSVNGARAIQVNPDKSVEFVGNVAHDANCSAVSFSGGTGQLVPIGGTLVWWDDVLPTEGGYVWANGVPISRAAYPVLFARWGIKFGAGDGSTTFGIPDMRDNVPVGKGTMGGAAAAGRITNFVTTAIAAMFGECLHLLGIGEIPSHNHTLHDPGHGHTINGGTANVQAQQATGSDFLRASSGGLTANNNVTGITIDPAGGGASHNNVQPSIVCNWVLRAA